MKSHAHGTQPSLWPLCIVIALSWATLALLPGTGAVFLSVRNLENLFVQISPLVIVSVAMTMVVLVRGIDLSVGAGVALTGVIAALLQIQSGAPAWLAIVAALACGALIGAWQGFFVARLALPAFVVSLAGFYAFRGLALVLSGAQGLSPMGDDFSLLVARAGLPVPIWIAALVALCGHVLTQKTRFGRHLYAIGGNPEAAHLAGISVGRHVFVVFVLAGVCTAIAGLILCARTNGVTPGNTGHLFELDVVTAVVIGGTSLLGGRGSILGSVLGAILFGTLANGMNLCEVDSNWQLIFKGLLLMSAVGVDVISKGRSS